MAFIRRFKNKVAIVTGAGSGIGLATALRLGVEGAYVVLVDVNETRLQDAKKLLQESHCQQPLICVCDVSNPTEVEAAVNKTLANYNHLDVIINNAGLMVFKKLEDHSPEDWMRVLGVDLLGAFYFIRQGFFHMLNGGAIVNVSSVHAVETTPQVTSYAAAKAAVLSLTRSAAVEGKAKKIRVNAVLPGAVDTPMLWENPNIKAGLEIVRKGDVGKSDDIAAAIAYLASDDAHFIQGTSLLIDGGRLAHL